MHEPSPSEVIEAVTELYDINDGLRVPTWVTMLVINQATAIMRSGNILRALQSSLTLIFYAGMLAQRKGWFLPVTAEIEGTVNRAMDVRRKGE